MINLALKILLRFGVLTLGVVAFAFQNVKAEDARDLEFFEKKIRPALVENCIKCHSSADKKAKGGLALDTKEGVAKGGETGPAVVHGKPELSLLVKAILYDGDLKMPPKGKLSAELIADLTQWVKMGAPDPRTKINADIAKNEKNPLKGENWWSFAPIANVKVPAVTNNLGR
ncbi:MAG: c-type cytochrome, partial [Gemmataceae bacterium]|nr:c-type cytochrome [Gemmataceae bacterium]